MKLLHVPSLVNAAVLLSLNKFALIWEESYNAKKLLICTKHCLWSVKTWGHIIWKVAGD